MAVPPVDPSAIDPGGGLLLAGALSPQIRSLVGSRSVDVLIPLGSLEQHGPHLPLATDTVIAEAVAREVAHRVGDILVAPCLPVGCSDHHLAFAGTASIPEDVTAAYIRGTAATLLGHGFRYAFLTSGHAGNIGAMKSASESLPLELQGRVAPFVDWSMQRNAMHDWARAALGLSGEEVGSHAGHFETSIMLYIAPEQVDMPAAPRGFVGPVDEASSLMQQAGMGAVSEAGVLGDARSATASAGKAYLEILVASVAVFVEEHRAAGDGE